MTQSIEMSNLIYIIFHVPPGVSRIQSTKMGELVKVKVIPRYQINRKAVILQIQDVKPYIIFFYFILMNSGRQRGIALILH